MNFKNTLNDVGLVIRAIAEENPNEQVNVSLKIIRLQEILLKKLRKSTDGVLALQSLCTGTINTAKGLCQIYDGAKALSSLAESSTKETMEKYPDANFPEDKEE
jgi:hypothetical protein